MAGAGGKHRVRSAEFTRNGERNKSLLHCGSSLPRTHLYRCRERPRKDLRPLESPNPTKHQFIPSDPSVNPRGPQRQGRMSPLTLCLEQGGAGWRRYLPPSELVSLHMAVPLYSPRHPQSPRLLSAFLTASLQPHGAVSLVPATRALRPERGRCRGNRLGARVIFSGPEQHEVNGMGPRQGSPVGSVSSFGHQSRFNS